MKKSLQILLLVLTLSSTVLAQTRKLHLKINHLLAGTTMEYMKPVKSPGTYYFKVEMLRYYISEIKITHDGGKVDIAKDVWILVNPEKGNDYDLGSFDITNVEAIEFGLGVDKAHNHLDPTTYPSSHPLAMQSPTMHWGWTSGYRFITFEGYAGATAASASTNFQLHTVDDANYKTVKIKTIATTENSDLVITLNAEYTNLLKSINANTGVISHASTGASATLMKNLAAAVFTATTAVAVTDLNLQKLEVFPNPAQKHISISTNVENGQNQDIVVTNVLGQIVLTAVKTSEMLAIPIDLEAGQYLISILEDGKTIGREKVQIID